MTRGLARTWRFLIRSEMRSAPKTTTKTDPATKPKTTTTSFKGRVVPISAGINIHAARAATSPLVSRKCDFSCLFFLFHQRTRRRFASAVLGCVISNTAVRATAA